MRYCGATYTRVGHETVPKGWRWGGRWKRLSPGNYMMISDTIQVKRGRLGWFWTWNAHVEYPTMAEAMVAAEKGR